MAACLKSEAVAASAQPPAALQPTDLADERLQRARGQLPERLRFLEAKFDVKAKLVTDPEIRADVIVTIGTATPQLEARHPAP